MTKLLSIITSGALAVLLLAGTTAQAQVSVDVGAGTRAETSANEPSKGETWAPSDASLDVRTEADLKGEGQASAETGAASSFSLTKEDAVGASLDAESAGLAASAVVSGDDLSVFATSQMKRDSNIENIDVSGKEVRMEYRKDARFLGFIPASIKATAEVESNGDVEIDYPWYRFLFSVEGTSEAEAALEARVAELMATAGGSFNAALEAAILEAMHMALAGSATADAGGLTADMAGRAEDMTVPSSLEEAASTSVEASGAVEGE